MYINQLKYELIIDIQSPIRKEIMSHNISQGIRVREEAVLNTATVAEQKPCTIAVDPAASILEIRSLQTRMESLEQQFKKVTHALAEREQYVNALSVDLEHMMSQLINKL